MWERDAASDSAVAWRAGIDAGRVVYSDESWSFADLEPACPV